MNKLKKDGTISHQGRNGGRPLKFETVEELEEKIDTYFNGTLKDEWTITGLALALDIDRHTLLNYERKKKFSTSIKRAKTMVENAYEIELRKYGRSGTIFALKNFGWVDRSELTGKEGEKLIPIPLIKLPKNHPDVSRDHSSEENNETDS